MAKKVTFANAAKIFLAGLTLWALITLGPVAKVLIIIAWALFLFTTERFPMDVTALLIMAALIVTGLVTPQEGVSGFSNTATLTVLFMFIISAAVEKTGVIQRIAGKIFSFAKNSNFLQISAVSAVIGPISGFINNTAAVAIFLPSVLTFSRKTKTAPTKLLIPLSYISMLGGMLTVFGTSTNILANDLLIESGFEGFRVFEFFWLGAIGLLVGVLYFLFIGRFILPTRFGVGTGEEEDSNKFLAELRIGFRSELVGKTLRSVEFSTTHRVEVLKIIRNDAVISTDILDTEIQFGDVLLLLAREDDLRELDQREHEQLVPDFKAGNRPRIYDGKLIKVLFQNNSLQQRTKTLRDLNFYRRYGLAVIGLHRNRNDVTGDAQTIADIELHSGEVFLAKVPHAQLDYIRRSRSLMVLEEYEDGADDSKVWKTLSILALVVGFAAFNIVPLMVAALLGVLALFMFKCITVEEIYNSVQWSVIFLLAGVIPLGIALQKSGAAGLLADSTLFFASHMPVILLLGLLYLITTLVTEFISNNAAVVLMFPIALAVALELGIDPKTAALIIMFAASTSFLSPVGYQTNAMVYGAGNYRFSDFIKVGAPLNIILLVVVTLLIYTAF